MAGLLGAGMAAPMIDLSEVAAAEPTSAAAAPAIKPPTLDEIHQPPNFRDAALSPNGANVASLRELREPIPNPKTGKAEPKTITKRNAYVALQATADPSGKAAFVRIGDYDVEQVEWANDSRLLIWIRLTKDSNGEAYGLWFGDYFYPIAVRRVMSVGIDGRDPVLLFGNQTKALKREFDLGSVVDYLGREPNHVLMQKWDRAQERPGLFRVNVVTGEAVLQEYGERATDGWFIQDGVPVLRFDSNSRRTQFSVYGRAPGDEKWTLINRFRRNALEKLPDFDVVGSTTEPGVLLISHRAANENFASLKRFDVRSLKMGEVYRRHDSADLTGVVVDEDNQLIAASWRGDRQAYSFEDKTLAAHFRGVNRYFKDECNVRLYDISLDHTHALFRISGPRHPGQFVYYNLKAKNLVVLGDQYEALTPERLARMEVLKVKTRDGAEITAFLSHPIEGWRPGPGKARPMIVMPHGGPEVRDYYDYDGWVQALCAEGWLVLQPNFRGSGGYGKAFGDAGRRHWGDRMQQDVEDAVAQVVASGLADPARLAIMGASYGGYAAMMGVVLKPADYRCAVAIAGDFDLMQSLAFCRREDGSDSETYAYWVASMGDPKTDKDLLAAHSPRQRVGEIQVPVMMIHGTEDDIVSPDQSREMAKALKKANKVYEHIELKGEGHRDWSTDNEKKVLANAIRFIGKAFG
jgi:dipeptidyl aminopeptidase/acylaminoacyl peptidase